VAGKDREGQKTGRVRSQCAGQLRSLDVRQRTCSFKDSSRSSLSDSSPSVRRSRPVSLS